MRSSSKLDDEQARKDRHDRDAILAALEAALKRGDKNLIGNDGHLKFVDPVTDVNPTVVATRLTDEATIILIRTANPGWTITDEEMITRYKWQWRNEHGFTWLKSGMHFNPVFLKTPSRIGSLCFPYTLGLRLWNLIQRTARKHLIEQQTGLSYHRGKPSNTITTRFYLDLFAQVQTITITETHQPETKHLAGFTDTIALACQALGTSR